MNIFINNLQNNGKGKVTSECFINQKIFQKLLITTRDQYCRFKIISDESFIFIIKLNRLYANGILNLKKK